MQPLKTLLICIALTVFLSSCGIFKKGKGGCDCPKFGEGVETPLDQSLKHTQTLEFWALLKSNLD